MRNLLSGLLALLIAFGGGYWYGKNVEKDAQQAEVDKLNTEARAKEQALTVAVNTTADALRKTNEKAKTAAQERDIAIDSGKLKLWVPTKTTCPVHAPADPTTPARDSVQADAELDREIAKALVAITEQGDANTRQLNACIDAYNAAYQTLKGKP
jgi:hypothetical protein